jgi:hypothetical protein
MLKCASAPHRQFPNTRLSDMLSNRLEVSIHLPAGTLISIKFKLSKSEAPGPANAGKKSAKLLPS